MPKDTVSQEKINDLLEEITMSEAICEQELVPIMDEALSRYMGKHTPAMGGNWDIVLNEIYPIIQNGLPSIFFRNPRAFLKPRNKTFLVKKRDPITGKMTEMVEDSQKSARTQEAILNYSLSEMKFKGETRKVLLDALLFPYGIMWNGYKGDFGMTEEESLYIKDEKVFVKRVNPRNFIYDPCVNINNIEEARWVGRAIDVRLEDLMEDDKLDVDKKMVRGYEGFGEPVGTKKQQQAGYTGGGDIGKPNLLSYASEDYRKRRAARFVRVYEVFLRPTKKEKRDGGKGRILLLTKEQKKPLRDSNWTIKAEGFPAKILEFNPLNDALFGLSDIETYREIADQKNAIINLQLRNAEETSKVWVGISKEDASEEDIEHVKLGQNTVILFGSGDPRQRMFVASPGSSASNELYMLDQRIQRNLEDKSGITDLKRGFLQSGEESATSVKIRAAGGGARPAYRQDIMADFLKEEFHYINQLNKQFMPFKDAVRITGTLDIQWSENMSKEELQADTDVEIDAISMLPENPESELKSLNETLFMAIQALNNPPTVQKLKEEDKVFNLAPLIERVLLRQKINDPDVFRNIKPEESMGFVSVQQLREAQANVDASLQGAPPPFPPVEGDDHIAKIETYSSITRILQAVGQVSEQLNMLVQAQSMLLQQAQEKQSNPGQSVKLSKPKMEGF